MVDLLEWDRVGDHRVEDHPSNGGLNQFAVGSRYVSGQDPLVQTHGVQVVMQLHIFE